MSAGFNQKSSKKNGNTSDNTETHKIRLASNAEEDKDLTFKDWKTIKDSETKTKTANKQTKSRNANIICNRDHRKNNADYSVNCQGNAGFPTRYRGTPKTFNDMSNFDMRGNVFGTLNNGYNSFNIFNRQNNLIKINSNMHKNFNGQHGNHFTNGRNLPDSFFASDEIYHQGDLMQKPLPNPFKNDEGAAKHNNEKNNFCKAPNSIKKVSPSSVNKISTIGITSLGEEPKIYVPNPNSSKDGKAFIPKPKSPKENLQISKEEKKQQWKEYREAMKPFKNREFYNAKRVVQRLGKKDIKELDEKELFRLTNARGVMAAHKARLTAKYSDYVKTEGKSNELGEVYVLKKAVLKNWEAEKAKPDNKQNYSHFRETRRNSIIEPGRKLLGGYSNFKGFIPGGMVESTTQIMGKILDI